MSRHVYEVTKFMRFFPKPQVTLQSPMLFTCSMHRFKNAYIDVARKPVDVVSIASQLFAKSADQIIT